ncbi:PEP-CTERM sorting domain-containing protein [Colwellia sp. E2M01]|uniref:PEP-CTERM sorting domain-containing protein n=1 Tax=Colwellia sp. E2M01 TaxID=2841561 RepID=UPI001C08FBE9|nr:PEP-CTERM sorting domain-containing protein [Colwellia sp. E2M01]MBU2871933.1 PEP-CTERM sorting domain-containing protein [Colwellia sp. E2M01]
MIKNKALIAFTGLLLAVTSITSQATIMNADDLGVKTNAVTWEDCPSYCTGEYSNNEGFGVNSSSSQENSYGTSQAIGNYSPLTMLPDLKVYAKASDGQMAQAFAAGVQGFNYTGVGSSTYDLDFNLHGSVSGSGAYLTSTIAVIIASELDWDYSIETIYYEVISRNERAGIESLAINNGMDVNKTSSISFDLLEGQSFFVYSEIIATSGSNDGIADGLNTLTMSFQDSTGLQVVGSDPSTTSVPEPSPLMLFGLSLVLFVRRQMTK